MLEEWKNLSVDETAERLDAGLDGLSSKDIPSRLEKYGRNEIVEKRINPILKFLIYFWGPIPWMIEGAAIISAVIRRWEDFWIITVLLLLNAGIGFWQERKADSAIELLKAKLALRARVRRDGKWQDVPAAELVPGDVIRVRAGEVLPADLKLIDGDFLQMDESALTGESLPTEKHVSDVVYSGTIVRQGEMNALVIVTGMETVLGQTARLVEEARTVSHFQKALVKIGDYLIVLAVVLVIVIFLVALYRHESDRRDGRCGHPVLRQDGYDYTKPVERRRAPAPRGFQRHGCSLLWITGIERGKPGPDRNGSICEGR
jgi:H+-transporting ATPase